MSYEDTLEVRKKHISPGVVTYYKNRVLIHQVGNVLHCMYIPIFTLYRARTFLQCIYVYVYTWIMYII